MPGSGCTSRRQATGDPLDREYKLYFRKRYGSGADASAVSFGGAAPLESLTLESGNPLKDAIALELARQIGVGVPAHAVVDLVINDRRVGPRLAREPVRRDQYRLAHGHDGFDFYRNGDRNDIPGEASRSLIDGWIKLNQRDIGMDKVSRFIDLDDLSDNIILFMICGASDWANFAMYRDMLEPPRRWRWTVWGLETCFSDRWRTADGPAWNQHWLEVAVHRDAGDGPWRPTYWDFRTRLFAALLERDPAFRVYFRERLTATLERVTGSRGAEQVLVAFPTRDLSPADRQTVADIHRFLSERGRFIAAELHRLEER